jgi:molybdopterin-binding protein
VAPCGPNDSLRSPAIEHVLEVVRLGLYVVTIDQKENMTMTLSARNRLVGKVTEIESGGVVAHVVVQAGENLIEGIITKRSAEEMKLKVGDTVAAVIKSTEVMLEKN